MSILLTSAITRLRIAGIVVAGLWAAVLWATLSQPAPPQPDPPPPLLPPVLRLVVASGQPAPTGGNFDRFDVTAQPIVAPVNAAGQIAFYASVLRARAREGIFLATGSKITKIAAVGDAVPGGGTLSEFARHPLPALNDAGHVAFGAAVTAARAGEGVFLVAGGTLKILALSGADAPGFVGATFVEFDAPAINDNDDAVFVATVRRGRETLQAMYLWSNGALRKLVAEGDPLPRDVADPGARVGTFEKFGLPAISNRGVIAFPATIEHGAVLGGIFVAGTRDLHLLVGAGALAPNGEMMVRFSERVAIDEDDDVAFGVQLGIGRGGHEAVLRVNTTGLVAVAITGQAAPGGGNFSGFGPWPSSGPAGRVAFIASVENGPGPIGIFAAQSGTTTRLVGVGDRLADAGTLPPLAINSVTSAGTDGGVTFATMGQAGEQRLYYFGPPARK